MTRKILNASEMGKKGGSKLREQKPPEYWREIGNKGNEAMRARGEDFYKERARKIVESRTKNKLKKQEEEAKSNSPFHKIADILTGK